MAPEEPSSPSRRDEDLVRDALAGDDGAIDSLVKRHHAGVYRVALGILGDADDAADATQESFVRAVRALGRFRGEARFRTWLLTIATNVARGMHRMRGRRREQPFEEGWQVAVEEPEGPDELTMADEVREVTRILGRLPEKQRMAVQLRIHDGLSFREVAEVIGSSEGAARVNYHHGIKRLREILK